MVSPFCLCRPGWCPHVIFCVSDPLQELLGQNCGPLQTLGLSVDIAPVYTDQVNWAKKNQNSFIKKRVNKRDAEKGFSATKTLIHAVGDCPVTLTIEVRGVAVSWAGVSQVSEVRHHVSSGAAVNG